MKSKFNLSIKGNIRRHIHWPQLFMSLQYHLGASFDDNKKYRFSNGDAPLPFSDSDLIEVLHTMKYTISYPYEFHILSNFEDELIYNECYEDAIKFLKLQLSSLLVLCQTMDNICFSLRCKTNIVVFKLGLCNYYLKNYKLCSSIMRGALEENSVTSPSTGKLLTLLMCAEFKLGNLDAAMSFYETAKSIFTYSLGERHPALVMLDCALSDLYYHVGCHVHSNIMVMKALDLSQRIFGDLHIVVAALAVKHGMLLLQSDPQYFEADKLFQLSFSVFENLSSRGGEFDRELALCLHARGIVAYELGDMNKSIEFCKQSISIAVSKEKYLSSEVVSCLFFLAMLYEKVNDLNCALAVYCDIWNIVSSTPQDYNAPSVLLSVCGKIMSDYVNTQPLHSKILFDSIAAEMVSCTIRESTLGCHHVATQVWEKLPIAYISSLMKSITEHSKQGNLPCFSSLAYNLQKLFLQLLYLQSLVMIWWKNSMS